MSDNTRVQQKIKKQENPYVLLEIVNSHNHCKKQFGEKQTYFSHMLGKETNGMPVCTSVRAGTWKLWEVQSSLGFWFPYMPCWLCPNCKALTALYAAIFRAVFSGRNLKGWGNFSLQDQEAASLLPAQNLQDPQAQKSSPATQPNPTCAAVIWLSTSPCRSGGLGNQHKYANTLAAALAVNNEVSHLWPRNLISSTSIQEIAAALLAGKWGVTSDPSQLLTEVT